MECPRHHPIVRNLPDVWIGDGLENEHCQWACCSGGQRDLFAVGPLRQLRGGNCRAGHERDERIQQQADTDVVQRRAAENGDDIAGGNTGLESADDLGRRKLLAIQILHDQRVVAFRCGLDELRACFFHRIGQIPGMSPAVAASPRSAFMAIRSTTPRNSPPAPIGNCTGTIVPPKALRMLLSA